MALPLLVFACVVLVVMGAYWLLLLRPDQAREAGLKRRLVRVSTARVVQPGVIKAGSRLSALPLLDAVLARRAEVIAPLQRLVEQAGAKTTVGAVLLWSTLLALVGLLVAHVAIGRLWVGVILGAALCPAPFVVLLVKRHRKILRFEELFPEAMDLMSRAMRAGHTFPTGLSMVAQDMPEPVAGEFRLLFDRQNYGAPLAEALRDFARRVPLLDARFFVTAVLTQREAGGNLAEVLDNLASVIRRRFMVKRQIRSKSAHGRLTGWVLIALPPAMAVIMFIISPTYLRPLVEDPLGVRLVIGGVVFQILGALTIRRLVRIDY